MDTKLKCMLVIYLYNHEHSLQCRDLTSFFIWRWKFYWNIFFEIYQKIFQIYNNTITTMTIFDRIITAYLSLFAFYHWFQHCRFIFHCVLNLLHAFSFHFTNISKRMDDIKKTFQFKYFYYLVDYWIWNIGNNISWNRFKWYMTPSLCVSLY